MTTATTPPPASRTKSLSLYGNHGKCAASDIPPLANRKIIRAKLVNKAASKYPCIHKITGRFFSSPKPPGTKTLGRRSTERISFQGNA